MSLFRSRLLALCVVTALASQVSAAPTTPTTASVSSSHAHSSQAEVATLRRLREGGNVILIRHERTEMRRPDSPDFQLGDCDGQRNLSVAGIASAHQSGEYIRHLRIPIGRVLASPMCRCLETARHMFGEVETESRLFIDYRVDRRTHEARASNIRALVSANLRSGPNTVMVAHIDSGKVFGVSLHEGEALVLASGPNGVPVVVGTLNANRWGDLIADGL
jgi:phosphohistidine phosphatase SixA